MNDDFLRLRPVIDRIIDDWMAVGLRPSPVATSCHDCARLRAEYKEGRRLYLAAVGAQESAYVSATRAQYTQLRTNTIDARTGLDLTESELRQHQDSHALAI